MKVYIVDDDGEILEAEVPDGTEYECQPDGVTIKTLTRDVPEGTVSSKEGALNGDQ